ncbi:hypothetical protein M9458_042006, partial [Cirrhinus mrigala]
MASSSLVSTGARWSTSSAGLPNPSGSALVSHPLLPPQDCTPSAAPCPFVPPFLLGSSFPPAPPQSLCHSGSAAIAEATSSALSLRILGFNLACQLSASGSTTTCSATVGRPPAVVSPSSTLAPPCISSTIISQPPGVISPSSTMVPPSVSST